MLYVASLFVIIFLTSRIGQNEYYISKRAWFIMLMLLLFMGLRYKTVFGDAVTYAAKYEYSMVRIDGVAELIREEREPLFTLLEYLCQRISENYTFFFIITSIPVVYGFVRLITDYSPDPFMSILLFFGLGCMYFVMAGLRQAVAMGFTMMAFPYAKKRKLIPFLLLCLIAYGFHNSSLVFIPVYFIINVKPNWKMWPIIAIAMYLGLTKNPIVLRLANVFTTKEYEIDKVGLNYTMLLIQLCFLVFCYLFRHLSGKGSNDPAAKTTQSLILMGFVGAIFQAFTPIKGEFFRVSLYFSVYLTLAVPATIHTAEMESNRLLIDGALTAVLVLYIFFFSGMRSYQPFFSA